MKKTLFFLTLFLFKTFSLLIAQCLPFSGSNLCKDANVFCSLEELNGYQCSNPDNSPNACTPFYPFIGPALKAGWWAFVCDGGNVTIDVEIISCQGTGNGIKIGLFSGCECDLVMESKPSPKCINKGTFRISESLTACKTYFLYIEGCDADICDFIIHTTGGSAPHLSPLGKINNDQDRLIKICSNACNENFTINGQNGNCEPTYHWTLNNLPLIGENNNIDIDFPIDGDFQLCVTGYIGYSKSGTFCEKIGPECTTIEVRPLNDRNGSIRYLCQEQIPYQWHDQLIVANGNYRNKFTINHCCSFDSVINFIVSNTIINQNIYFVGCNTLDTYTFPLNNKIFNSCTNDLVIYSSKSILPNGCDSSINLTTLFLDFGVSFREDCIGDKVEIAPRVINKTKSCGGGESFEFFYKWFDKNDKNRKSIGENEILQVDKKGDYCMECIVITKLGTISKKCVFEFCETIDENDFVIKPLAKLKGNQLLCPMDTSCIQLIEAPLGSTLYSWNVIGGTILTPNPFLTNQICVAWNSPSGVDGKVCASYETKCGKSETTCLDFKFGLGIKDIAGLNKTVLGLKTNLSAKGIGRWEKVSGPGKANFSNVNDPNSNISVSKYGIYVLSWISQKNDCLIQGLVTIKFIRA
ncbi:MAG: hypothetical protein IPG55_17390 [Saprospiraceae bacterium]|nr:hypothetical protein [Candidatus Defluviibacterium haderslevense]MBK7242658.1 hypothetical protein [Candidatus Defluviibacterium haderslevense]